MVSPSPSPARGRLVCGSDIGATVPRPLAAPPVCAPTRMPGRAAVNAVVESYAPLTACDGGPPSRTLVGGVSRTRPSVEVARRLSLPEVVSHASDGTTTASRRLIRPGALLHRGYAILVAPIMAMTLRARFPNHLDGPCVAHASRTVHGPRRAPGSPARRVVSSTP